MEDILCDFHVSQAMANQQGKSEQERNYLKTLYFASVLEKYGVTRADFDSSLVYYYIAGHRRGRDQPLCQLELRRRYDQRMDR